MEREPIEPALAAEKLGHLAERSERWQKWSHARRPKTLRDVLAQVISKRGYGANQANEQLAEAWAEAAGDLLAARSRAVRVQRGRLEVIVASSTVMQQLSFEKQRIVSALNRLLPEARINDLRARVGAID
ncbi:MAG: DUF721 domain-containing protein [Planctomycetota bacterium]